MDVGQDVFNDEQLRRREPITLAQVKNWVRDQATSKMEAKEAEKRSTGLKDVLRILEDTPQVRLLSLTYQLGACPEEDVLHALTLIVLNKGEKATNKLNTLGGSSLAKLLAEQWRGCAGKLEDFRAKCGDFEDCQTEILADLARIFKVLSEQRLCDTVLRDLAYQRAVIVDSKSPGPTSDEWNPQYTCIDQLKEEGTQVCGPKFGEWMCSLRAHQSASPLDTEQSNSSAASTHLLTQDQLNSHNGRPSPLQTSTSVDSFPSQLEISLPSTLTFVGSESDLATPHNSEPHRMIPTKRSSSTPGHSKLSCITQHVGGDDGKSCGVSGSQATALKSSEPCLFQGKGASTNDTTGLRTLSGQFKGLNQNLSQNPTTEPSTVPATKPKVKPTSAKQPPCMKQVPKPTSRDDPTSEEEPEDTFYSFVIFHAPEDEDMAESMKERFESYGVGLGATFAEAFEVPGRSTLACLEDAINNSAFIILLLTRNFNTRLLEVKTDSALINSITKKHRHNTVIPLLPRENCMPRSSLPIVLQTLVPLDENKALEKKIRKVLSPANIEPQREVWRMEQRVKKEVKQQERLTIDNRNQRKLMRERREAEELRQENLRLLYEQKCSVQCPPPQQPTPQHPYSGPQYPHHLNIPAPPQQADGDGRIWLPSGNIHIENAQYIMIGNDSQMTVDLGGSVHDDDFFHFDD